VAPFFTEEVRKYLEQKYGAKALYESGLSVQTGIDIRLQRAANARSIAACARRQAPRLSPRQAERRR
jgi:penicillin-binding protein 1A